MNARRDDKPVSFVPMRAGDVAAIGIMDRRNYEFAWTDGIFRDCVKAGYICPLLKIGEDIAGYGVLQIGADEAHLLNLCIDRPWQRQGLARTLLEHLVEESARLGAQVMFLEVRPSNTRAVALYQQSGFNEIGLRKDYYDASGGREDALVMARYLSSD
ncbi:ribosomal protein S18-alanine N-acetyltransferase [Granulosicoccus sp. 3-233]|uniref:ribosomal protein S18-alanine N-acetyltransferase n=1 Tax=Granulosicoccus sp. 3-233 TaxID=3417969 RepID=UPI003D3264B8